MSVSLLSSLLVLFAIYRQCFTGVPTVNEMVLYVPGLPVAPLYSVEIDISFI